jgi:hypothetical protein
MASDRTRPPDRDDTGHPSDLGLDSNPELVMAVGEELLDRARELSQDIADRVHRTLGPTDGADRTHA